MCSSDLTVVGFLAGIVGTQFIVTHTVSRFVVFFLATVLNAVVFMGLYEMLGLREFDRPIGAVAVQALANALVGVLVFQASELMPGVVERRRNSQAARVRR